MSDENVKEKIEIVSLVEYCDDLVPKLLGSNKQPYTLDNIRAIILYQNSLENENILDTQIDRLYKDRISYHFTIDTKGTIYQLNPIDRVVLHCRTNKYTRFANEYFGDIVCPLYKASPTTPHVSSPNFCSIGINIPKVNSKNNINPEVQDALIKLCSYIINGFSQSLQAQTNVLCDYKIDENCDPTKNLFFEDQDFFHLFRYRIEKKRTEWLKNYGGFSRGYPTLEFSKIIERS